MIIFLIILYAIFFIITLVNSKLMLANPYPFLVTMSCALINGFLLVIYSFFINKKKLCNDFALFKRFWREIIVFGSFVYGFAVCCFSFSVQYATPIKICFIFAMAPFTTMLLEYFFSEEKITLKKIVGLLIGLCGLLPVLFMANNDQNYKDVPIKLELFGEFMAVLSMFISSFGWILIKQFFKKNLDCFIQFFNGIAMIIGGIATFCLFFIIYRSNIFNVKLNQNFVFLLLLFILLNLIAYIIYPYLSKAYSITFITFAGFLEPAFGLIFNYVVFGNKITLLSCISLLLLIVGLYLYYKEETSINLSLKNKY